TSLLSGGYGLIDPIARATGATFTSGSYLIDCNATFPSLFLTLDGTDYEFPAKTVIMKSEYDGGCYLPFDVVDKQEDRTAIYIGEPIHNAFCLVLDPVHDRIGFAPAKPRK
ncbi:pepsin F-like protein, partial [Aphelenchoides avenae]